VWKTYHLSQYSHIYILTISISQNQLNNLFFPVIVKSKRQWARPDRPGNWGQRRDNAAVPNGAPLRKMKSESALNNRMTNAYGPPSGRSSPANAFNSNSNNNGNGMGMGGGRQPQYSHEAPVGHGHGHGFQQQGFHHQQQPQTVGSAFGGSQWR
jgi:hypothetical protein